MLLFNDILRFIIDQYFCHLILSSNHYFTLIFCRKFQLNVTKQILVKEKEIIERCMFFNRDSSNVKNIHRKVYPFSAFYLPRYGTRCLRLLV